jgi:hypothetical protein
MYSRLLLLAALGILVSLTTWSSEAKDSSGQFAIKGVGNVSCQQFVQILQNREDPQKYLFIGWMNGYITSNNYYLPETFDLVAWENAETLINYVVSHCQKKPQISFYQAVTQLNASLFNTRIDALKSEDGALDKTMQSQLYYQVRVMVQTRLQEQGYFAEQATGKFDIATYEAIAKFKQANQLGNDAVLDQATLFKLLRQ